MKRFLPFAIICLALAGCRPSGTGGLKVDPKLAAFVPDEAIVLAGFRLEALKSTPLYQRAEKEGVFRGADDFVSKTNFDPRKDVKDLLIASSSSDWLLIAQGRFEIKGLEAVPKSTYQGVTLYGEEAGALAILDQATALAGPARAVKAALDHSRSGATAPVLQLTATIPAGSQVWAVSRGVPKLDALPLSGNMANLGRVIRSLERVSLSLDFAQGANGYVEGQCATDQDCKSLSEALRGVLGLGRLSVPDNQPELLKFFDGIKVSQDKLALRVDISISDDIAKKAIDQLLASRPRGK